MKSLFRSHQKIQGGFTLIETLVAMMIMTGGIVLVANSWSGNTMRLSKARINNSIALLLQQKMTEIEIKYQSKTFEEIPEEEEGDFGQDYPEFTWTMQTKEFEIPDMSAALITREGGVDEMLLQVLRQMSDYVKQVVKEVSVTVIYKGKFAKKEIKNTVTTYFIDYKKEVAIGPAGAGGNQQQGGGSGNNTNNGGGGTQ